MERKQQVSHILTVFFNVLAEGDLSVFIQAMWGTTLRDFVENRWVRLYETRQVRLRNEDRD
jgi:hypothetical protein